MKSSVRSAAAIVAAALVSVAVPQQAEALVVPAMTLKVTPGLTRHQVCASGRVDSSVYVTGQWVLRISGTRSSGDPVNDLVMRGGPSFSECRYVDKAGSAVGQYYVSFEFAGAGADVIGRMSGFGSWQSGLPDIGVAIPA